MFFLLVWATKLTKMGPKNVTFLKEIEDNKNRPGTKIYLERQKNEEVVCSPAEQGDAESWVVFCPEARAAC